ncbi:hypothetical protein SCA6_015537 [Theobroma cacao]
MEGGETRSVVVANVVVRAVASGLVEKSEGEGEGGGGFAGGILAVEDERMDEGEDRVAMGIVDIGGCDKH